METLQDYMPIILQVVGAIVLMVFGGGQWQTLKTKRRNTVTGVLLEAVQAAVTQTYHAKVKAWKAEGKGLTGQQAAEARVTTRAYVAKYAKKVGVDLDTYIPPERVDALIEKFVTKVKADVLSGGVSTKASDSKPGGDT